MDHYRKGGDSLQGRYHFLRLHPFSIYEIQSSFPQGNMSIDDLFMFGGFPEPLLARDQIQWRRWQNERMTRVIKEDVTSLENVREISQLEILVELLKVRVGSVLSINNLREELVCAHESVERWVSILENLYFCFRIAPFGGSALKASKKEKKLYLWDWSLVPFKQDKINKGARFENLVASNLLKYCHFQEDTLGFKMELRFFRDKEKREVDFIVLKEGEPVFAVECKTGEDSLSKNINYLADRSQIPIFYQVHLGNLDVTSSDLKKRILPFEKFCMEVLKV